MQLGTGGCTQKAQPVRGVYAAQCRVIGTQLDLSSGALDIIERDKFYQTKDCCNAMLRKWLQVNTTATWRKLFTVIESPAVFSAPDKGD